MKKIQLENIIEPHTLIETKNEDSSSWVKTVVLNTHNEFLEISQVEEYIASVLMIGDALECRIVNNETIVIMKAEVYNIKFASCSVVLKVKSIQSIKNMRKHKRYDIFLSGTFSNKEGMFENYCVVSNVSLSGLSIISRSNLNKGDIIEISINCKKAYYIAAECKVEWAIQVEKNYICGLSILNMDELAKSQYRSLIRKLQRYEKNKKKKLDQA